MTDRDLAGIAADQVPGGGGDCRQQHQRRDALQERVTQQERDGRQNHQQRGAGCGLLHARPNRPCGRTQSRNQEQGVDHDVLVDRAGPEGG